jgi:hypothetical protein
MATSLASLISIRALAELSPGAPQTGAVKGEIAVDTRTSDGQGSGQADRAYFAERSLSSGATHTYNVLAAGSLTDLLGQAIDLDEVKTIAVQCLTGAIKVEGGGSNVLGCFTGANEGVNLSAGQVFALSLGAAGVSVGSNGTFVVTETASSTASYRILIVGAQ